MVAVMEIPREETRRYGVLDVVEDRGKLVRAKGVVEKPEPAVAPSTLMIIGRYISVWRGAITQMSARLPPS
jgi:UTP--glucose-1-phosphate uridylyltransferase